MIIDARGLSCPQPLIEVKKVIDNLEVFTNIEVLVDDDIALCNVVDYLSQLGIKSENDNSTIRFQAGKINTEKGQIACSLDTENHIVVIKQQTMGNGSDELGKILLKAYISTLIQIENLPTHIIFYNSGVELTSDDSSVRDSLLELEQKGVMIIICGACVDYFDLKNKISVGIISNMYKIAELLHSTNKIIYP